MLKLYDFRRLNSYRLAFLHTLVPPEFLNAIPACSRFTVIDLTHFRSGPTAMRQFVDLGQMQAPARPHLWQHPLLRLEQSYQKSPGQIAKYGARL